MAIKEPAMRVALLGSREDLETALAQTEGYIATLDKYHGQVAGVFTGDESLAGLMPSQGTELCAVVEYLFSLSTSISVFGTLGTHLAERWERIAYNALPAPFTPDMCAHQYVQQVNQIAVGVFPDRVYTNNGPDANVFGLEPHFGCCTANMHQGFPKLAQNMWMGTKDGGLVGISYAPVEVMTSVADGALEVTLAVEGEYPFRDKVTIRLAITGPRTEFPMYLRIPEWCLNASVSVNGIPGERNPEPGTFHKLIRHWADSDIIRMDLAMDIVSEDRPSGGLAIRRGPLLYSLVVDHVMSTLHESYFGDERKPPFLDYAVAARTPWNYALDLDSISSFTAIEQPIGDQPWSPKTPPIAISGKGYRLPMWTSEHSAAAPIPAEKWVGEEHGRWITLIPYGSAILRITEFPLVKVKISKTADSSI